MLKSYWPWKQTIKIDDNEFDVIKIEMTNLKWENANWLVAAYYDHIAENKKIVLFSLQENFVFSLSEKVIVTFSDNPHIRVVFYHGKVHVCWGDPTSRSFMWIENMNIDQIGEMLRQSIRFGEAEFYF